MNQDRTRWELFVYRIMLMWDASNDTKEMASMTGQPEHRCAMALREGREQRLREKSA